MTGVIDVAMLVAPMVAAAAVLGGLLAVLQAGGWPWALWVVAAPVLYLGWLIAYLALSALICREMGRRYPKPGFVELGQRTFSRTPAHLGLLTALACYRRLAIVEALPFARATGWLPGLGSLYLRAYSPAVPAGSRLTNWGYLCDPDLTEIGDDVVLGGRCSIVAHSMTVREDGAIAYTSAPVRIGHRVTVGGESLVGLGCVIGDDSVLEQRSVVAPYTRIPAGEVWGGNPARRRRRRGEVGPEPAERAAGPADEVAAGAVMAAPAPDELRQVVLAALQLPPGSAPAELAADTCSAWDSLGQVAIAAAVFDRYGVEIPATEVFALRTLAQVADAIAHSGGAPALDGRAGVSRGLVLPRDPELLPLLEPQEATSALAARFAERPGATAVRVCVAASFTAQPLAPALRVWGRAFGFEIECEFAEYDQIVRALLDPSGAFAANRHGLNVVLTRPEDVLGASAGDPAGQLDALLGALEALAADPARPAHLLVGTLPPVVSAFGALPETLVQQQRSRWATAIAGLPGAQVLDLGRIVERVGIDAARSSDGEALSRAPYSPRVYQEVAVALVRHVRAARRAPAKVLALDCDNTLWGGVVGEVGIDGIDLGPDGPGRAFQLFQRSLKQLEQRGVLLVVVSKNEAQDVREVFERHPGMVLRLDDIAAWRVGWGTKSQGLRELAEQLGLGLDSFVLVDDDPAMRLEVETVLPEVHVLPLPAEPSRYTETLSRLWLFDGAGRSAVDGARTRMMRDEARRAEEREATATFEDFLRDLELEVDVDPPAEHEWARVGQLTQRTNQFNLSLVRRSPEDVRDVARDATVLVAKARDRFGDYGLIGVATLRRVELGVAELDTLLMSCRALGRGVEQAFLHAIAGAAVREGADALQARFVPGPRNAQVREYLLRHAFVELEPNLFSRPLDVLPGIPAHVRVRDTAALPEDAATLVPEAGHQA